VNINKPAILTGYLRLIKAVPPPLVIIALVAAVLRLININYQSLWFDELHCVVPTAPENSVASIIEYCKIDQPPAFFIYLHFFFKVFGYHEVTARIASALLGIIAIPVIYALGKECSGKAAGLMAAWLTAFNYFHIYYSQEVRFYSMLFLFTALSFLFLIRWFKYGGYQHLLFYAVSAIILLYTHYYGLVIAAAQAVIYGLYGILYKQPLKFWIAGLAAAAVTVIAFLPWVPVILHDLGVSEFWIRRPKASFLLDYFYAYFGKDIFQTLCYVALIVFFVLRIKTRKTDDADFRPAYLIIIVWIFFSYLIPYVKSITGTPVLHIRYTMIALPAWILMFSIGWNAIEKDSWKKSFVWLIPLSVCVTLIFFKQHYTRLEKQQFREVSQLVIEKNTPHLPMLSLRDWHFNHYFRDQPDKVQNLAAADLSGIDEFWFLHVVFFADQLEQDIKTYAPDFEIAEHHQLHQAGLVKLVRKKPIPDS
jgi:uncharacterized membrane protein